LPDGSFLYLNQNSTVKLDRQRHLVLSTGEIFLEVAPPPAGTAAAPFTVRAGGRNVSARGTRFAVRAAPGSPGVIVAQGRVHVDRLAQPLLAGQQLLPGAKTPSSAPRASHLLGWTRELMATAQGPLVKASRYAGGRLVVATSDGGEVDLSLRKYHIDVHIEDGFARTTIDQTYFNHDFVQHEGTFKFPLPPDASLSRLAMYVNGHRMEGGMAERAIARGIYEDIVSQQRDPALLEWVEGSTFQMRVFPLEPRQEKRIILSYTQKLESLYGQPRYHFPAGHSLGRVRDWSFHARVKGGTGLTWASPSHVLTAATSNGDLFLDAARKNVQMDRDVVLELSAGKSLRPQQEAARFSSAELDGDRYLMFRYRPVLTGKAGPQRRDWVVLFDSSGGRTPLLARTQIEILRALLANAGPGDTFAVIAASTRARSLNPRLRPVTPKNVRAVLARLGQTHLLGALDLGQALAAARPFLKAAKDPWLVHVGSGAVGMGERRADVLARGIPHGVRYVGIGVGQRRSHSLMRVLAERSDGYTTRINPNEPIAWRAFDLMAALNAPRLLDVRVSDPAGQVHFLNYANSLAQGEELCAVARLGPKAKLWPKAVVVTGKVQGRTFRRVVPVTGAFPGADYLPRTWAKLEIDRLLADGPHRNRSRIVALSKAMYVLTPFTSLLVLENEAMYKQYKVDRGRKDHWAIYPCPAKIRLGREADTPPSTARKPSTEAVLRTILVRLPPRILRRPADRDADNRGESATAFQLYAPSERNPESDEAFEPVQIFQPEPTKRTDPDAVRAPPQRSGGTVDIQEQVQDQLEEGVPDPEMVRKMRQVLKQLAEPVNIPAIKAGTPLQDALDYLSTRFKLTILTDIQAFKEEAKRGGPANVEETPVKLQPLSRVALGTVLRLLLRQVPPNGAAYLVRRDMIEVTTRRAKAAEEKRIGYWVSGGYGDFLSRGGRFTINNHQVVFETGGPEYHRWPSSGWKYQPQRRFRAEVDIPPFPALPSMAALGKTAGDAAGDLWGPQIGPPWAGGLEPDAVSLTNPFGYTGPDDFASGIKDGHPYNDQPLLYRRPTFSGDVRVFQDLTAYAPGLNTTRADVRAVLEAEAEPGRQSTPGRIDPAARKLINRARAAGWRTVTVAPPAKFLGSARPLVITLDGGGRFTYRRTLPSGLREHVVCDGKTLLHQYPDLGLGARRRLSRFHLLDLGALVPWVLPPPEDLARGADLRWINSRTVAVVPHDAGMLRDHLSNSITGSRVHLVFAKSGGLAERRLVSRSGKVLYREQYTEGRIRLLDAKGREMASRRFAVNTAGKPELTPDTTRLVVLPFPLRTRGHVLRSRRIKEQTPLAKLAEADALALLAADFGAGAASARRQSLGQELPLSDEQTPSARGLFRRRFHARGVRSLGFYTLLAAAGLPVGSGAPIEKPAQFQARLGGILSTAGLGPLTALAALYVRPQEPFDHVLGAHPRAPLARYLAVIHNPMLDRPVPLGRDGSPWHRFLQRLLDLRVLSNRRHLEVSTAEVEAALRRVRQRPRDALGWAALTVLHERLPEGAPGRRVVTEALGDFAIVPGLRYASRYERARALLLRGRRREARTLFRQLYAETLRKGRLPRIDRSFRQALPPGHWAALARQTAALLVRQRCRSAVVALAWQCWQLGDPSLAGRLLATALRGSGNRAERLRTTLGAIQFLWLTNQLTRADWLLQSLLADRKLAGRSSLWRLGAALAVQRRQPAKGIERLEHAVEIDWRHLPDRIDVEAVRTDFRLLLGHYLQVAEAGTVLKKGPPRGLITWVVRTADCWRALNHDDPLACPLAAQILFKLGAKSLAWEYLNTPIALFPPEPESWRTLAQALARQEDFDLANRAYEQACQAEPDNARMLWERAQNLERSGRRRNAARLYRRLARGPWEPRFRWVQEEARRRLAKH
jgi:hypothetical protein